LFLRKENIWSWARHHIKNEVKPFALRRKIRFREER